MKPSDTTHGYRRIRLPRGVTGRELFLAIAALLPVLLIGYSLAVSLMAPDPDMTLIVSALLITGVGGFVVRDIARFSTEATQTVARVKHGRRPAIRR